MSFHTFSRTEPTFRKSQENWETEGDLNGDGVKNMEDLKLTTKEIDLYFEEHPSRPDGNCFYHSMVDYIQGNDTEIYKTIFETPAYLDEWIKEHALYGANSKVGFKEEEMFMMHWLRKLVSDESLKPTKHEKKNKPTQTGTIEFRNRLLKGVEQTKTDQNVDYDDEGEVVGNKSHGHVDRDLWTMDREIDVTARLLGIEICTLQTIDEKLVWVMSHHEAAEYDLNGRVCFLKNNGTHFTNLTFKGEVGSTAQLLEAAQYRRKLLQESRERRKLREAKKEREKAKKKRKARKAEKEIPKKTVKNLVQEVNAVDGLMELVNQNDDEILNLIGQQDKTNKEKIRKLKLAQQRLNNWDGNSDEINEIKLIISLEDIDVNQADSWNRTPLWIACEEGHVDVVRLLLARKDTDVNQATKDGITPLWTACQQDHVDVVRLLLVRKDIDVNQADGEGATPLYIASFNGHTNIVQLLLKHPNINQADAEILKSEQDKLIYWDDDDDINDIKSIISLEDIDVNQANEDGVTPLYYACQEGHVDVVRLLLARKDIHVNQADNDGVTPLYRACWSDHREVVNALLAHPNIDVNKAPVDGETPLWRACSNGHVDIVRLLLARKDIDVNQSDNKKGETPFFRACRFGHVEVVQLLLDMPGININQLNSKENKATSLYIACQNGHADVVKLLLTHKDIDVNIPLNTNGASPLYIACGMGHADVVQLLLAREDIDVNQVANDGTTPLQIAQLEKQTEIVALLSKSKKK